ncbi:MAG: hypothetical protein U0704_10320 [Candidatus Eisenbacteria bacterium]
MTLLIHASDSLVFAGPGLPTFQTAALTGRVAEFAVAAAILAGGWGLSMIAARGLANLVRRALPGSSDHMHSPARLIEWTVRWSGLTLVVLVVLDRLGVPLGRAVADRLATVLPRILAAGLLFIVGTVVAMVVGALAGRFFESAEMRSARLLGRLVTGLLIGFAALLAVEQLGFAAQFVTGLGLIAAACAGLTFALAFGLGSREVARDVVIEYLRSLGDERPAAAPSGRREPGARMPPA